MVSVPRSLFHALRWYVRYAPANLGKRSITQQLVSSFRGAPEKRVVRTELGLKFQTATDDLLQGYLYLFGVWEPNLTDWIRRTLRQGDTFIDVGANIGYFTVLASRLVAETGNVVAVEPAPEFATEIEKNLALNACRNVRLVNAAVSDGPGWLDFYQPNRHNRGNTTCVLPDNDTRPRFSAGSEALPDLLASEELKRARLVKIDVEGAEGAAVRGLLPALPGMRPDVELIVEINPELLAAQGESAEELVRLLESHRFHAYRIPNGYCIPDYLPRRPPIPPRRWTEAVSGLSDYVFSRRDVDSL